MKKSALIFALALAAYNGIAQCLPPAPTGHPGFCPPASAFPCIPRGQQFSESIQFEYYDSVNAIVITSISIDSIANLPAGISYQVFPDSFFALGEAGCIQFAGISNEATGNYQLDIYVTITVAGIGSFNGEISQIDEDLIIVCKLDTCPQLEHVFLSPYYLRIVEPGGYCPANGVCLRDSLVSVAVPQVVQVSVFPNPTDGKFSLSLNRNISDFDLQIFDLSGKLIQLNSHLQGNENLIDVHDLENGIYFYQLIANATCISKGKIAVITNLNK